MASCASACSGRVLVRGREPRPGADPDVGLVVVASAQSPASALAEQHVRPHPRKVGQRLGRGADVLDLDAGHAQPDDGTRRCHSVIRVGAPDPAVQRPGRDEQAVGRLLALAAEAVDLGAQRGQPVGFVAPQMRDAAQSRDRTGFGQRGQRRDRRCQLADVVQVGVKAAVAGGADHLEPRIRLADNRTQLLQQGDDRRRRAAR